MINKLVYMFKRSSRFYIVLFIISILEIFQGHSIDGLLGIIIGMSEWIILYKLIANRNRGMNVFLGFGGTRTEFYTLTVIYDFLMSTIISMVIAFTRVKNNNIDKNYFIYVFLFYLVAVLVFFSTLAFSQIFRHTDYLMVRFGMLFFYAFIFIARYSVSLVTDNFTNFNEELISYPNFTLKEFYIMFLIIIGFNYITSYLVNKSTEIKIKGELE
ncbi:hypothetical protein [Clostridium sp. BSD9I1]|uniref:hypothetical protein n=1 Tax=Clostridium sp. BSD9I1 TaxID=2003589 RepID=UPI001645F5BF|nr:hypothetical protein [Clostridium sp. BSD9I1]